jgi:hypothetical protein
MRKPSFVLRYVINSSMGVVSVKAEGKWKVSFEYDLSAGFAKAAIRKIGSFVVDAKTGDIEGMWLDRAWK